MCLGFIIRDYQGWMIKAKTKAVKGTTGALMGKALACRFTLEQLLFKQHQMVIIGTDNQLLFHVLKKSKFASQVQLIIQDRRRLLSLLLECQIFQVKRLKNMVGDVMIKGVISSFMSRDWKDFVSRVIWNVFGNDLMQ